MLQEAIKRIVECQSLNEKDAYTSMNEIMKGEGTASQIGAFLSGLRVKGETIEEITGFARAMRANATPVKLKSSYAIDTCGTGGDGGKTFNISTAVAIIAAAGGVKVAKHGNKAVSSNSGSADVLRELGLNIDLDPLMAANCIDDLGMAFLFAQHYHSAMKNVAGIRRELGIRTVFNILGPLTNPAEVKGQVLGVYHKALTHTMAEVLLRLGSERVLVVHGEDGLDEITTTGVTFVSEVSDGRVIDYIVDPRKLGISLCTPEEICGGDPKENAQIILGIFEGHRGPKRDIVVINSAAALYIGNVCRDIREGIELAEELIDSGKAVRKMQELVEYSRIN
jgi:anthranilate phosphoribosyltransferase